MFIQNRFRKKHIRAVEFRCEMVSVLANNKACHVVKNFIRFANDLNDFLFLVHYNMEKELKRKILWKDIIVKNIETHRNDAWEKCLYGEHSLPEIKFKAPR